MKLWPPAHERRARPKAKGKIKHAVLHRYADMIGQPAKLHTYITEKKNGIAAQPAPGAPRSAACGSSASWQYVRRYVTWAPSPASEEQSNGHNGSRRRGSSDC
jgi:hypothetical protein